VYALLIRPALRGVIKEPAYLLVRVLGLAIGVATACVALAFVRWELGFDGSVTDADRIYRIVSNRTSELPAALGPVLDANPRVRSWARISGTYYPLLANEDRRRFPLIRCAENELLQLLDLRFIEGNRETALTTPHSVVITEELRRFYFGDAPALGGRLRWDNGDEIIVTGVVAAPRHSHLVFDALASWDLDIVIRVAYWRDDEFERDTTTYVLVDDASALDDLAARLEALIRVRWDDWEDYVRLQPLTDIYLEPPLTRDLHDAGDPWAVTAAVVLAAIVILLAAINFVNITVAQFSARTREIGVRKSLGGSRGGLFAQFLAEALFVSVGSTLLGLAMVTGVATVAPDLAPVSRSLPGLGLHGTWGWMLLLGLFCGLAAGCYPAWVASRWHVVAALRGTPSTGRPSRLQVREVLLLLQLALCLATLTTGITVYGQARKLRTTNLGFHTDHILISPLKYPQVEQRYPTLRAVLPESPHIEAASAIEHFPVRPFRYESIWDLSLMERPEQIVHAQILPAPPGYLALFDHQLLAGRDFVRDQEEELDVVLLNRTAARELGVPPGELAGKTLRLGEDGSTLVVGIIEDFHFEPLQRPIIPLVLVPRWADQYLAIRLTGEPTPQALAAVHRQWTEVLPDFPLNYTRLSDEAHATLAQERTMSDLLVTCGIVILAIALLGVFAMTSYASRRRAKEIAVRRVLGATLTQALYVIVSPYLRLVMIAIVLTTPPAVVLCLRWLDAYPERISATLVLAGAVAAAVMTLAGTAWASGVQAWGWTRQAVTTTLRLE
jgi:putative ABC transport system permease protein